MKQIIQIIIVLSIVSVFLVCQEKRKTEDTDTLKGMITMSGAWALYPMAVKWAEEFMKIYPEVRIDISAGGAGKGMADVLSDVVDIGNVSREVYPSEIEKGAWWVSVVKDAVVPTINENNPYMKEILSHGITQQTFQDIWINGKVKSWGEILNNKIDDMIHIYTRSDACGAAQTWAQFLGANQEDLMGIGVYGDPGLAEAVIKDIFGIGFNNINYAYDSKDKTPINGLCILPIDLNSNNKIDPEEDFYFNRDGIIQAISEEKYPSPPARNLHFVCHGKPQKPVVVVFINWVLTDGQQYVDETGYIPIKDSVIQEELEKLK